jgi:hypothetical protein
MSSRILIAAEAEQVFEIVRPALDEFFAGDELVDQGVAFVRIAFAEERFGLFQGGNSADGVEVDAAQKLAVGGKPGMRNVFLFKLTEDLFVDEITPHDRRVRRRRRTQARSLPGERGGVLGWVLLGRFERLVGALGAFARFGG